MFVPDTGKYEASRRGVDADYGTQSANNAYGRFISQQRGSRQLNDMQQGFKRSFPSFASSFAQRGLSGPGVQSGTMQRSMQNYLGDFNRDYSRANQDMTQGLQQYDRQQADLDAWRTRSLADIEMQKQNEIARAAQNIEALRPILGGL